jgi:outer membrane protein OmpA-like peptidoglycan-associated protein
MRYWFWLAILCVFPSLAPAAPITVNYHQNITVQVAGATAAFSLNSNYVEASAQDGVVTIYGKLPGSTNIIVVTPVGTQTFEVVVPVPPPVTPPGFEPPLPPSAVDENGSYEVRYSSDPNQIVNVLDFVRRQGDSSIRFHMANAEFINAYSSGLSTSFPSLSYEIQTRHRDITLLDQYMQTSPLTVFGSQVRGIHYQDNKWLFHFGYTSQTAFQNLFLPSEREMVAGAGRRFTVGEHSTLTTAVFYFPGPPNSIEAGHEGAVGSLLYDFSPSKEFDFQAELGISHGVGTSFKLDRNKKDDQLQVTVRSEPKNFGSLSTNNLHGFYSNVSWLKKFDTRYTSTLQFTGNRYDYPSFRQDNIVGNWTLAYKLSKFWSVSSGAGYSEFRSLLPVGPTITNYQLPVGLEFQSKNFGNSFQYQFSRGTGGESNGSQEMESFRITWRRFFLNGFAQRQTEAPTVDFIFQSLPGLEQTLERLGISASTPEEIAQLLETNSTLIALGYVLGANVNLAPLRVQSGANLIWNDMGPHHQQVNLNFLYNSTQFVTGSSQSAIESASYSRKLNSTNDIFASYSLFRSKVPGINSSYQSIFEVSLRHQFYHVPSFIIPSKHGTISGIVFEDSNAEGKFHSGMPVLQGVEIILDGKEHTRTDRLGLYAFHSVPFGPHTVEAKFESSQPYFFTTPSHTQADYNSRVDFGIGYSLSELFGYVKDDAGHGMTGIRVNVKGQLRTNSATTDLDGKYTVQGLPAGDVEISIDDESLPPGYAIGELKTEPAHVTLTAPTHVDFQVRALRSISGKATAYDAELKKQVPVGDLKIMIPQLSREATTNAHGVFLFRDMPSGHFTVQADLGGKTFSTLAFLPPQPTTMRNVDLNLGVLTTAIKDQRAEEVRGTESKPTPAPAPPVAQPPGAQTSNFPARVPSAQPPLAAPSPTARLQAGLRDVFFAYNSSELGPQAQQILKQHVAFLKAHPGLNVELVGRCDERGSSEYNFHLGCQRASAVKAFFVTQGIEPKRISLRTLGKELPLCSDHTAECWKENRRVNINYDRHAPPKQGRDCKEAARL